MADFCGPSNALKSFQKHTSVDRTLLQDRVGPFRPDTESFRSRPGQNAAIIDAEFEAFRSSSPLDSGSLRSPSFYDTAAAPALLNGPQPSAWASDFQNLQLNNQYLSPVPLSQFYHAVPIERTASGSWHQEFAGYQKAPAADTIQQQQLASQSRSQLKGPFHTANAPIRFNGQSLAARSPAKGKEIEAYAPLDDETFIKAFEEAEQEAMSGVMRHASPTSEKDESIPSDTREPAPEPIPYRIGSDRMTDESQRDSTSNNEISDADELARTAGNLLENLKDDRSKKFQESNFLSLMRQLRDREVKVEGDKIVNAAQPLHPGGVNYPHSREPVMEDHYAGMST